MQTRKIHFSGKIQILNSMRKTERQFFFNNLKHIHIITINYNRYERFMPLKID